MQFCAHRGDCRKAPENTMPAFLAAVESGFERIETDPVFTKDGVIVLLHDRSINRTARNADGSEIEKEIFVEDLTHDELLQYDFGIAVSDDLRGTKVARLEELLILAEERGVILELDKKIPTDRLDPLLDLVKKYNVRVEFSTCETERIKKILSVIPDTGIIYDGNTTDAELREVCALVPYEQLTVYMYYDNPNFAWLTDRMKTSPENCARVKKYARLAISNVITAGEMRDAIIFGADIVQVF